MVSKKQILSAKDESDPKPWYEMHITNLAPEIVADNDGGTETDTSNQSMTAIGSVDPDNPTQDCVYAVTVSGDYICYPQGRNLADDGISLRAHLAWYEADTDEFTVLEFVEL